MELSQHGFLEEILLAPKRETWMNELFPNGWNNFIDSSLTDPSSSFLGFPFPSSAASLAEVEPTFECPNFITAASAAYDQNPDHRLPPPQPYSFVDGFTTVPPENCNNNNNDNNDVDDHHHQNYPSMVEDDHHYQHHHHHQQQQQQYHQTTSTMEETTKSSSCNMEQATINDDNVRHHHHQVFNMGLCSGDVLRKIKTSKKLEGQPSKNLMAERRRRKRLNDRLSMLRSIVPKISKMDRTSILGDTIDYVKELLERINELKQGEEEEEIQEGIRNNNNSMPNFKELKPSEVLVRNSSKFDVERREMDTRIDICCGAKPGLLLSTVSTIEALGLEIQHCVISCFSDFSLQASCSEMAEQGTLLSSEDIKQALFRNAGYGGRCL